MENYRLKYIKLPATEIHNLCDAMYIPEFCRIPDFWENENLRIYLRDRYIEEFNNRIGHYYKLEEDILEEGFRNPVLVTAGFPQYRDLIDLPPYLRRKNPEDLLICESNGGSRLSIAQKYEADVPCLVSDFVDRFPDEKNISLEDAYNTFLDKPGNLRLTPKGLQIVSAQYSHINDPNYTVSEQSRLRREIINDIIKESGYDVKKVNRKQNSFKQVKNPILNRKQSNLVKYLRR